MRLDRCGQACARITGVTSGSREFGERLAVGLREIEHVRGAEADDGAPDFPVVVATLVDDGREDGDAVLTASNEAMQCLPGAEPGDLRGVGALRGDQAGVGEAVAMEAAYRAKGGGQRAAVSAVERIGECVGWAWEKCTG